PGWDARAGRRRAGDAIRRRHVRIGPVVDVEQHALRALEEDTLAGGDGRTDFGARVRDVRRQARAPAAGEREDVVGIVRRLAEQCLKVVVLLAEAPAERLAEPVLVEEIAEPDAGPG